MNVRVAPAPASRLDGDEPREIDTTELVVERPSPGRAVVTTAHGRVVAVLGADRPESPSAPRTIEVVVDGWRFELEVDDAARAALRARASRERAGAGSSGRFEIRAIIPGRVVGVAVAAGDDVVTGQTLLVVEAMKMQNELRAPRDGRVERVAVGDGATIDLGDVLVVLA
jgi:biotin carboxyl carrier protein